MDDGAQKSLRLAPSLSLSAILAAFCKTYSAPRLWAHGGRMGAGQIRHQERLRPINEERSRLGEAVVEYPIPWLPGLLTMNDPSTLGIVLGLPLFFALLAGAAVASL